jgi:hypothetical protein
MAEVSAEQRQKAKAAAANAAVAANDTAVVLGGAGIIIATVGGATGLGAPAGLFVGGILGVGSFAAWAIGNRYQRLANDPPRDDFDQVTISGAQLVDEAVPAEEPQATFIRYAANQLLVADAMAALVTSLERFDGAVDAGDQASANAQGEAVKANADLVVSAQGALIDLAGSVNAAWATTLGDVDTSVVSFDNVPEFLAGIRAFGSPGAEAVFACVTGLVDADPFADQDPAEHPLIINGQLPDTSEPISPGLNDTMTELSDPLSTITNEGS